MKELKAVFLAAISMLLCVCLPASGAEDVGPVSLLCEYRTDPIGIDVTEPRLSWRMESDVPGEEQSSYHILVASSRGGLNKGIGDLWDSGKVDSDQSIHIAYAGKPLISEKTYYWKVRTWGKDAKPGPWSEPAQWTMGLVRPEDWQAKWIRAPKSLAYVANSQGFQLTAEMVRKASYQTLDGSVEKDVTAYIKTALEKKGENKFMVAPENLGGDPAPGIPKELVVEYVKDGKVATIRAKDFKLLFSYSHNRWNPPCPWLRQTIEINELPEQAPVYVESRGYHELWVNGRKVGDHVLSPAVSVLKKRSLYVGYDIAPYLSKGSNVIGLWLGRGWNANGIPGVTDERPVVRLQGDLSVGGDRTQILSDGTWQCAISPYRTIGPWRWNNHGGERYDARLENPAWSTTKEDTSTWSSVEEVPPFEAVTDSQLAPLNRIGKRIPAVSCTSDETGGYTLDFGTDLTGWLQLKMPLMPAGTLVSIEYRDSGGGSYNQRDEFISAGRADDVFVSKFNYRGFRTVEVKGLPSAPALKNATALLVESDLEQAGFFECSNELINRIYELNMWTIRCLNLGGYMVDCPHRERLGYGDGQVAVEGSVMNFWMPNFYEKWLDDWADIQGATGEIPFSTPYHQPAKGQKLGDTFGREGPPGWGGALPAIAWRTYLYYGNTRLLKKMYEPMSRFMERIESHTVNNILRGYGEPVQQLGDWVPPGRGMDSRGNQPSKEANELFNNCYRIYLLELMEKSALALGLEDDAAQYRAKIEQIRPLIHQEFYDPAKGIYVIDEQAYQVMPLMAGVVPESLRPKIMQRLEEGILVKNKGHLDTGMLGTYFLLQYLSSVGRDDLLFTVVNKKTFPGWGYMLEQGATTMWEQWNGHWSRIHSCFTSPAGWFHNGLAGIQPDPAAPGFKHVIINPAFVGDLTWVKAHHDSPYGRIVSNWNREDDRVTMDVTIPANSSATVYVPAKAESDVTVNGKSLTQAENVTFLRVEEGRAVVRVGSGSYKFLSKQK